MQITELESIVQNVQNEFSKKAFIDLATLQDEADTKGQIETILSEQSQNLAQGLQTRLHEEYFGLGPLEQLVSNKDVTEIIVNGPKSVWYEKDGRLYPHDDHFLSNLTFRNAVRRLCRQSEAQVTLEIPYTSGAWKNFRVQVVGPPVSKDFLISLRARPENPWTFDRLVEKNWCSRAQLKTIQEIIHNRSNFLVVGPTGSGKTSVLNACLKFLGPAERVMILEDTDELNTPNDSSAKLLTRMDPNNLLPPIDLTSLLRQSLRLRPDRLVIGEVRGSEAKDLLLSLATGHSGSLGTLHASSSQEALIRLEMLVQLGAPQWAQHTVRRLIQLSLHHVIVAQKRPNGERYLDGVYKLSSLEEFGFLVERLA
jgi:pilus assembly protein CpaF